MPAMEPAQQAVLELIEEHGGVLARTKNHFVYKFPDGKIFTIPSTPSDHRGWLNCLSDLKRVLGVEREKKEPREKERKAKPGRQENGFLTSLPDTSNVVIRDANEAFRRLLEKFEIEEPSRQYPRTHRAPSERHGIVRRVPPEVLNEVNYLIKLWGEEVGQKYLQDYLEEQQFGPRDFKKKENGEQNKPMAEPLEIALETARTNLQNLNDEILELERKSQECLMQANKRKEQISVVQDAITSLELTVEAFKKAGPALRNILPVSEKTRRSSGTRTRASAVKPNFQAEIVKEAQQLYGDAPFTASSLYDALATRSDWAGLKKSAVYNCLSQQAKDTAKSKARLRRVGDGQYQVNPERVEATVTAA